MGETETEGSTLDVTKELLEFWREADTNELWDIDGSGDCVTKLETLEVSEPWFEGVWDTSGLLE